MTKERLEELIKQGTVVYCLTLNDILEIDLSSSNLPEIKYGIMLYVHTESSDYRSKLYIDTLFETKEQAEWVLKTYAERTERFEPPMWEEIKDKYSFMFADCNNCVVHFSVFKNYHSINHIVVYKNFTDENVFYETANKENYEKACEIVRDLFRGGAK